MLTLGAFAISAALLQPAPAEGEPPANWRFKKDDRPVKVIVLAGSIGAYRRQPYAEHIGRMCKNVEVKNLSKTGLGAWALKKRFKHQVLKNRRLDFDANEHWLVFGGGLNSVGTPKSTNWHMRNLFVLAHAAGIKVVGLTLTPWGSDDDRRFKGLGGLKYLRATKLVADYVLGRLTPAEALGSYAAKRRDGADAPWSDLEKADVGVDLFDSDLRDRKAKLRDVDAMRALIERSRDWQRSNRDLGDDEKQAAMERDAHAAAELPRWYMRPALRSFDHIHPNAEGHRLIAEVMCPKLPESWGCTCGEPGGTDAATVQ